MNTTATTITGGFDDTRKNFNKFGGVDSNQQAERLKNELNIINKEEDKDITIQDVEKQVSNSSMYS